MIKKYKPTMEELFAFLKRLVLISFIRPSDLEDILIINLKKYNMMDHFDYFKTELLKIQED